MECELLPGCKFFSDKMSIHLISAEQIKAQFCKGGDYSSCARFRVYQALGPEKVPADLLPNLVFAATEIIQRSTT